MSPDPIDFATMLCSRLCHDLLSPVGAFGNGVELLAEEKDPDMRQRCIGLLEQSARASADKLKFFRLAFGASSALGDDMKLEETRAAIAGILTDRTKLGWLTTETALPKSANRVLLNLALIASDALVRGGELDIAVERNGETIELVVRGAGDRIALDPEIRRALEGGLDDSDLSSRTAAGWMTARLVEQRGGQIMVDANDTVLVLGAAFGPRRYP